MKNVKEIRFVTTNFYNLQGLRLVPLGLLIIYVGYWANTSRYPVEPAGFINLIAIMVFVILAAFAIDLYYKHAFGMVKQTPESRRLESQIWTVSGVLTLIAFWLDVSFNLPLSIVGLVAGLSLIADYLRITWMIKGRFLIYYPVGAAVIIFVSLLPLFGLPGWWHALGLRAQMFGIAILLGIFTVVAGVWSHLFLVKTLRTNSEEK